MAEQELSDGELLRLYFDHFGMRRAVRMFGWAVLWGSMGLRRWPEVEAVRPPGLIDETTWYRALAEWREFRTKVAAAEGRELADGDLAARVVRAAQHEGTGVFASAGVS